MPEQANGTRPPDTLELRKCPDPVDGSKGFITRQITVEHCEQLQAKNFHACGGCVHAHPETVARLRRAVDMLMGKQPTPGEEVLAFQADDDAYKLRLSVADTKADLEEAYCLVYRTLQSEGLPEGGPSKSRLTPFHRLPAARTFLVHHEDRLVGTLTVLPDSVLGLPTDELYHAELKALRESGRTLCEVLSLAVEAKDMLLARAAQLHLFRAAYRYADRSYKATDLCALVPVHHEAYYRRQLMFERLGDSRIYSLGAAPCPAVGLRLDLTRAQGYYKAAYGKQKGMRNLYDFFVKRDVKTLNAFLKRVQKLEVTGQVGGPGQPALLAPRPGR